MWFHYRVVRACEGLDGFLKNSYTIRLSVRDPQSRPANSCAVQARTFPLGYVPCRGSMVDQRGRVGDFVMCCPFLSDKAYFTNRAVG